jgi:hypothetical protein
MAWRPGAQVGAVAALAILASAMGAAGQQGCDAFKWSVAREHGWFQAGPPPLASGGALASPDGAVALALLPVAQVHFPAAPERAPKDGAFGGVVTVNGVAAPGLYQISLSDDAWIDVVQNGALVASKDFSGKKDCPGLRKSVRFEWRRAPPWSRYRTLPPPPSTSP